jgi:hypothetical protein
MTAEPEPPVACALPAADLEIRLAWIRRVTEQHLLGHLLQEGRLRLTYSAEAYGDLEQIVERERACCSFLQYSLERVERAVRLTIEVPEGVEANGDWLLEQFLPRVNRSASKSCGCAPGACR